MSAVTHERALLAAHFLQNASVAPTLAAAQSVLLGYNLPAAVSLEPGAAPADCSLETLTGLLRAAGLGVRGGFFPADTLGLLATRGPLVTVARQYDDEPAGMLVIWRRAGPLAHVLDTRAGRRWLFTHRLAAATDEAEYRLSAEAWRTQAELSAWMLQGRLVHLIQDEAAAERLVQRALGEPGWRPLAALDAAIRLVSSLSATGATERGSEALALLERLFDQTLAGSDGAPSPIPAAYWAVCADDDQPEGSLICRGVAVALVSGPASEAAPGHEVAPRPKLPNRLADYWREQTGLLGLLGAGLGVAAAGVVAQALILRGLLVLGQFLPTVGERTVALGLLLAFVLSLLLLEGSSAALLGRLGRRLDARLRIAFMTLLPRLGSQTIQRLSTADLMERIHTVRDLHNLPELSAQLGRTFFQLLFTLLGLALISPIGATLGLLNVILVVGLVLVGTEVASAQHRMVRAALAALSRLALDGMLGSVAIHAHLAGPALQRRHERLLAGWTRWATALAKTEFWISALGAISSALLVAVSVWVHSLSGTVAQLPLLLFWSLQLGTLSDQLARLGFLFVGELSKGERYVALTDLPAEERPAPHATGTAPTSAEAGVAVVFDGVAVEHDGQTILKALQLRIAPGSHVAIVGASGAGKSTLLGLLLGRSQPACGTLLVDGQALTGPALQALRAQTAWVDPGVQIWNRSFLQNITYGSDLPAPHAAVDAVIGALIEQLPNGMQSTLGERGRLVSGGQGQRVRYGRAIQRQEARLVILDEPFRGLDREQRRALLDHARTCWPEATLLCVTHDVAHTIGFERVLVLADGQLVEDGCPTALAAQMGSRYGALLAADQALDAQIWAGREVPWRRVTLSEGHLETPAPTPPPWPASSPVRSPVPVPAPPHPNRLCWAEARLPELLAHLARRAFVGVGLPARPDPPQLTATLPPSAQIPHLVGQLGLEAEPFSLEAAALDALLHRGGPTLLRLDDGRWIALLGGGRVWAQVIGADGTRRHIAVARLRASLRGDERPAQALVASILAPLALDERAQASAARALLRDQLGGTCVAQGWSLRLASDASLWAQLRRDGLPQALLFAALCEALLSILYVLSISGAGLLAAQGQILWPWLHALVLGVLTCVPLELFKRHWHLTLSLRLRTLLKRRLHVGVIRLMPNELQQYGIGQFLSWQMEAERLESIVSAGPLLLNSVIALLICAALLAGGAAGGLLAPLLLGWIGGTALLSWRAYRAYLTQRRCHIETSRDTLERLDGHMTRLVQECHTHWHSDEDAALERYLALAKRDDNYRGLLATLVPYGWLLLALAALAPTLLAWSGSVLSLGLSLLGITWAFQLLRSLGPTILDLSRAVGAWRLLAPIEQAARRTHPVAEPPHESGPPQTADRPILEARNLSFGYLGQRQPLLNHCDLAVYYGERLLLTGPSGGGKSTLAALLARLRPTQSGLLLLNGLDQHTLSAASWRQRVVMVAQFHENHLFSDSLAFNLLMGRQWPPCEEDLREAAQVCRELGLDDLLCRMPAGLGQQVGEGGWQLSHGERSRLFVARALLQQAHVLILDESLAAVDATNLRAMMTCVLTRAPTLILIAHP